MGAVAVGAPGPEALSVKVAGAVGWGGEEKERVNLIATWALRCR